MTDAFDGEAIARADREFLASLSNHPLAQHPLYSVPYPPPNVVDPDAAFQAALDWMVVNYGFFAGANLGRGGVISLVDGKITTVSCMRDLLKLHAIEGPPGPRGGKPKKVHVVDKLLEHPLRVQIDGIQCRCDKLRPTFEEDGVTIYNRYWPPAHPKSGGEIKTFKTFFARLFPDKEEREWLWNYFAHKARKPWVPMVAVIMVAEEFGTGRGTLFNILELVFGENYVAPCEFGELTGKSPAARFNDRLANALIATVNEADDDDGHLQTRRRLTYEALKNAIEPSPTARRRFEAKGQHAYAQRSARSTLIATQHRDVVKLPRDDRRICVITCGDKMTAAQREEIRAWMAIPENIGALHRALLATPAVPLEVFDPFGDPPPFAGRLEMIGMGETRLEDAYGAAIEALEGFPLFTMTQAQRLIGYFGDYKTGEWTDKARHTVARRAYRLRERGEPNNRIEYRKRQEIIYARAKSDQRSWHPADTKMIIKQLDRTEAMIVRLVNTGMTDIEARIEELRRERKREEAEMRLEELRREHRREEAETQSEEIRREDED
jgi:uncharacterized protein DUF5906